MKQACSVQAVSNNNSVRLAHPKFEEDYDVTFSVDPVSSRCYTIGTQSGYDD